MYKFLQKRVIKLILLVVLTLFVRYVLEPYLKADQSWIRIFDSLVILVLGGVILMQKSANIIEETTEVLSERTKLAGGFLQAVGTAFPDMVLGVVAALDSLSVRSTDYTSSINLAIIASSTTFGSNIYNVIHAAWCLFRQNLANKIGKKVKMFPLISGGMLTPVPDHKTKPSMIELDAAIDVSMGLTVITTIVAVCMVLFGRTEPPLGMEGELYQLIVPIGILIFAIGAITMYLFRGRKKSEVSTNVVDIGENYFRSKPTWVIWVNLFIAGVVILLTAECMVMSIKTFCDNTGVPFVIAGVLAGIIGCLGEMMIVHNYSVHASGRIGDAVMGVAMDNIATIMVAGVIAVIGGVFLGGDSLILIFVVILSFNSILIWQISKLKSYLLVN